MTRPDRRLSFPLLVEEFSTATLTFDVPAEAARALVPGTAFELVEPRPGVAQFVLIASDFQRTQWGACHQMTFAFIARPAGAPPGLFVHRMPVDEAFTCAIGHAVMDFPVSIELIEVRYAPDEVAIKLAMGVNPTLELRVPRTTAAGTPGRLRTVTYSYRAGVPYAMPVETDMSAAYVLDPASVILTLGNGPVAEELRDLGLPTTPTSATWGEALTAAFHHAQPVPTQD